MSSSAAPGLIYDYFGFPAHTYQIRYAALSSPDLARRVRQLLNSSGIACHDDPEPGFDHATYSMMKPLWPDADIPVVQLPLSQNFDPQKQRAAGRLLSWLRDGGVLILGSEARFHNMSLQRSPATTEPSRQFDAWLQNA